MEVRPVRPEEFERAGEIVVAAYRALPGFPLDDGYAAELAAVEQRAKEATVLVAADGAELVGCATYVPDASSSLAEQLQAGEAAIRMLATVPVSQGRGAGRAMVEACIELAVSARRSAVFLHSSTHMDTAHRLYRRMGFVRVPERDWLPVPEVPLLAFRLELGPP